ncbi:Carboxypeptidase A4 [Holothuria leucospilota]|uniref:Carboxypeptidase A4 n=1 Tax=Holothuria leucospilota TaxID=206669 RepID=A0A9Q1C488_HOLLE|nr:Carboxypeptidase A4 [Holothuria leucospilota]
MYTSILELRAVLIPDPSSGASEDYGYASTPGATYSYTVELRDTGEYGFLLPADQIIPTGEESYNGVVAMMDWITANDYE